MRIREWARNLRRDVTALWLAARDERVPLYAKLLAAVVAAYALSPIDLIPDFIPILGWLDDLLLIPAGIWMVIRLMPAGLMAELRAQASSQQEPASRTGIIIVATVWGLAAGGTWLLLC